MLWGPLKMEAAIEVEMLKGFVGGEQAGMKEGAKEARRQLMKLKRRAGS